MVQKGNITDGRLQALDAEAILDTDRQPMKWTNRSTFSLEIFIQETGSVQGLRKESFCEARGLPRIDRLAS